MTSPAMTQYTHNTAPTQFADTSGIRFAYRRFGTPSGPRSCSCSTSWATWTTMTQP